MNNLFASSQSRYTVLLVILIIALAWLMAPLLTSVFWSIIMVVSSYPLFIWLTKKVHPYRQLAIVLMLFIWLLFVILPIGLLLISMVNYSDQLLTLLKQSTSIKLPAFDFLQQLPGLGKPLYHLWQNLSVSGGQFIEKKLTPYLGDLLSWLVSGSQNVGLFIFHGALVFVISYCGYFYSKTLHKYLRLTFTQLFAQHGENLLKLIEKTIKAVIFGVVGAALLQALLSSLVLWAMQLPLLPLVVLLIFISCLLQIGPLPILIPILIGFYWQANWLYFVLLLAWSLLVSIGDNILSPYLFNQQLNLPTWLVFFSLLAGVLSLGLTGLFIGPIVFIIGYYCWLDWLNKPLLLE